MPNQLPLYAFILAALTIACRQSERLLELPKDAPNFVILLTDDQRFDALGVAQQQQGRISRFPWFQMPTVDSMAQAGAYFKNAFVTTSLCSPSRASILTGQRTRHHGIRNNHSWYNSPSFASELSRHGYHTAYFGKWHMGEQSGKRPGFDYSFSFIGQGEYQDVVFEENGNPVQTEGWVDHVTNSRAADYVNSLTDEPFCLFVGYKSAHGPWNQPPTDVQLKFASDSIYPVPNLFVTSKVIEESGIISPLEKDQKRQDLVYFQYLAGVDRGIRQLIETLNNAGKIENTYFIFLSDNGFFMHEHFLRDKRLAYDESIRVPMIIIGPRVLANQVDKIVLNIDLAPTILELAGIPNVLPMDGRSLVPILENRAIDWREYFVYEYFMENNFGIQSDIFAIRDSNYKLVRYPQHPQWDEFFDLVNDPYEINNLISDRRYYELIEQMDEKLDQNFR